MSEEKKRKRSYCFVWNNYPEDWIKSIDKLFETKKFKYIIGGKEVGESGTPHIQGHLDLKNASTIKAIQKLMKKLGLKLAIKTFQTKLHCSNNRTYCKKDNDFTEWGAAPAPGKRTDLHVVMESIAENPTQDRLTLMETFPMQLAKHPRFFAEYKLLKIKHETLDWETPPNIWIWGAPGVGKSRKYREESNSLFSKPLNKWWDGYDNEEDVLVDDFDHNHAKIFGSHLKIWADRYPFIAQIKGFCVKIRPKRIIVTSNYPPEELFADEQILLALQRRFTIIHKVASPILRPPLCKKPLCKNVKPYGQLIMRSEQHE